MLTGWALSGRGIINKPRFEVEPFIRDQRLKVILASTPPTPVQFAAVYPHKKLQDPKVRLLLDFMAERCQRLINGSTSWRADDSTVTECTRRSPTSVRREFRQRGLRSLLPIAQHFAEPAG